jgi:hypothetical protein
MATLSSGTNCPSAEILARLLTKPHITSGLSMYGIVLVADRKGVVQTVEATDQ